jgi:radical SAM superfamily enzyme YgiQ (UPF0313 family)
MFKVSTAQFNYRYGDQIHFPYSIGRLVAYVKSKENLEPNFEFDKTCIFRDKLEEYIKKCKDSDILLCSCYVWNWEITKFLAQEVKKINPNCLIIFGGPQIPDRTEGFFEKFPFVDILVHGEGEYIVENIFNKFLTDKDFSEIQGIETKNFRSSPQPRIKDLNSLPSPYLTNLVWDLVDEIDGIQYIATWETNRGCPYQCTFCDWGSLTNSKMTNFSEEKLFNEIEWFGKNKITYIDCCDANFGILQARDLHLATKLKEVALKTGFPEKFRAAWAKFASEKIIPIAKELQTGGILKAVSLSLQSLDETTLEIVKRANMKFDTYSELTGTFREHGIPTYTELIMGMPGETLDSWKKGLETLVSDTKTGSLYIYNCGLFTNAPMNEPVYVKHHNIKAILSPIYLGHSSIHERGMPEYENIVISTVSFTTDELKQIYLYSWLIQTFHSLGIFEYISKYYNKTYNLPYMKFYEIFLDFCNSQKSIFSKEYQKVLEYVDTGYSGKGWNHYDPKLGDIFWPIEEATWLRLISPKNILFDHTEKFLRFLEIKMKIKTSEKIMKDLIKFQLFLLTTRDDDMIKNETFEHDWKNFFILNSSIIEQKKSYFCKNLVVEKDPILWNFKTVWYGRQIKNYKTHPEDLEEDKIIFVET